MVQSSSLKELHALLESYSLLYVEDNVGLNAQATTLFKKILDRVYSAHNGEEGLELFKKYHPQIVITDISMPKRDGLEMAEDILKIDPEIKIIVTTAHDDHDFLHRAIRIGIFDYLTKPIGIESITTTLTRCAKILNDELHRKIFNANLHAVFNYQNNNILLLHGCKVVMVNQPSLDFFGVPSVEVFQKKFLTFGELLLEHNGFLYNHDTTEWFESVSKNQGKLFNVKIADTEGKSHHFILNFQPIPEKEGYGVLSLNDVTELGLLNLYDTNATERERLLNDEKGARGLLEMAMRNGAKIRIHNLYKGLNITNDGVITQMDQKEAVIQVPFVQLKAIQKEKMFFLTSELFPMAIYCNGIKRLSFDLQNVTFEHYKMVETSPINREAIRIVPDENARITLFYEGRKFMTESLILDISIKAVRLQLHALPSGFEVNQTVVLDIVLSTSLRPFIINTKAKIYQITEDRRLFTLVCTYELHGETQKNLIDYIAKQQMVLIREFKGMQQNE